MDKEVINQDVEEKISFSEIWTTLKKNIIPIILIIIISIAGGIGYDAIKKPEYVSKAAFLVQYESRNDSMNSDYQFSKYISNTYIEFIKKDIVLSPVSKKYGISISELRSNLSITTSGESLILDITYSCDNQNLAQLVLDSIVKQTIEITNLKNQDKNPEYIMLYNNLKVLSEPCSAQKVNKTFQHTLLFFLFGCFISLIYIFIISFTNNKFKSVQEVENILGLPVLTCIPNYDFFSEKRGKKND